MVFTSVPGVHNWGNMYALTLLGAYGLSSCHGGGL
jgi:hypothetical protein